MTSKDEVWKAIPGWEGHYEASSLGRIRNLYKNGNIVKGTLDRDGYRYMSMYTNGAQERNQWFHVLICMAFYGPKPYPTAQSLHKDDDKSNNIPSNLYWGTHIDNTEDMKRNNPRSSLTWERVREIRHLYRNTKTSQAKLGKQFKVSQTVIFNIVNNYSWIE